MELAQYLGATVHASDTVTALHATPSETNIYFARREGAEWWVVFGRLTAAKDTFLLAHEARQLGSLSDSFSVETFRPARPETGSYLRAARAIDVARRSFISSAHPTRPYNVAVLLSDTNEWLVYVFPAQTRPDVWPLGGDVRYRVSSDGNTVLDARRMHNTIIEYGRPTLKDGDATKFGMHTAVLGDLPEDTDVLHVMMREPSVPEVIVTDAFVFQVNPSGAIRLLGTREEFLKT
jgi:hypothetical protein